MGTADDQIIDDFSGKYRFLSNFYPAVVTYDGLEYPSVENAYQAAKAYPDFRAPFATASPNVAKKMGRRVTRRDGFEETKLVIMAQLLFEKFKQVPLRAKLLSTGAATLIEGNDWNDTFWGVCRGRGANHLGFILMAIRQELAEAGAEAVAVV